MAIMFDYMVKYNGKYYPPNTPIEEVTPKAEEKPEVTPKAKKSRSKAAGDAE